MAATCRFDTHLLKQVLLNDRYRIMLLNKIHSPLDIKNFSQKELAQLADEIRKSIIETVATNGGHLASNLGAVELTIALHRVFDSPRDAIIFDVSHQCYTHKLLTGRYNRFKSLRKKGGISGFTKKAESEHDYFDNGHASNAISEALGLLTSWELKGDSDRHVICVIGDGALTGGMAFEGLMNAGQCPYAKNLVIIVNDNQMSIERNTGSLSSYLSRLTMTSHYQRIRRFIDKMIEVMPFIRKPLSKFVFRFKRALKGLLLFNNLFSDLDFEYVGPLDGHDERGMERILHRVKNMHKAVVVHVVTKKGKGYKAAEDSPEAFHGVGPFCITDGKQEKFDVMSFTQAFSDALMELAKGRPRLCCVTAAMAKGTGLAAFSRKYREKFFDVGIAEEHAITFAGALARGGATPVVCIYSTFLQRAIDQVIEDVALQGLHVVIVADRAGAVPNDGETHQGVFDIALLRAVPAISIMSPATSGDLAACLKWAVDSCNGPVVIRYPKASCPTEREGFLSKVVAGRGVLIKAEDVCPALLEEEGCWGETEEDVCISMQQAKDFSAKAPTSEKGTITESGQRFSEYGEVVSIQNCCAISLNDRGGESSKKEDRAFRYVAKRKRFASQGGACANLTTAGAKTLLERGGERSGKKGRILFVTTGSMFSEVLVALRALLLRGITSDIYTLRFIAPFDRKYFLDIVSNYAGVVFVEDGVKAGGVSESLALMLAQNGYHKFVIKAFPARFFPQGTRAEILEDAGLSPLALVASAIALRDGNDGG